MDNEEEIIPGNTEEQIETSAAPHIDEDSPESMRERLQAFISKPKEETPSTEVTKTEETKIEEAKPDPKDAKTAAPQKKGSDGLTKEERSALLEYKTKAEKAESRISELEAKVASGEATAKEAAELKSKVSEWERKYGDKENELKGWLSKQDPIALEQVRLSEEYQEEISKPSGRIEESIKTICKGYDVDPESVIAAHYNKDRVARNKALSEIKSTMDDESRAELTEELRKLAEIDTKAAIAEKRPQAVLAAIRDKKEREEGFIKERDKSAYGRAKELVYKHVVLNEFPLLGEDKAAEARVKEKVDGIDWDNITPDKKAYLAHGAFLALEYRDANKALAEKLKQAEASIAKLQNKPGLENSHQSERKVNGNETAAKSIEDMTAEEHYKHFFNRQ